MQKSCMPRFALTPLPLLICAIWSQTAAAERQVLMPQDLPPPSYAPARVARVLPPTEYAANHSASLHHATPLPVARTADTPPSAPGLMQVTQVAAAPVTAPTPTHDEEAGAPAMPYPVNPYLPAPVVPMAAPAVMPATMPRPVMPTVFPVPATPSFAVQPLPQPAPTMPFGAFPMFAPVFKMGSALPQAPFPIAPMPAPLMMPPMPGMIPMRAPLSMPMLMSASPNLRIPVAPTTIPAPVMLPQQAQVFWSPVPQPAAMPFGVPQAYFPWLNPLRQPVPPMGNLQPAMPKPIPIIPWVPQQAYLPQQMKPNPFMQAPYMVQPVMPPATPHVAPWPQQAAWPQQPVWVVQPRPMPLPTMPMQPVPAFPMQVMPMQPTPALPPAMTPMAAPQAATIPPFWMMPWAWFNGFNAPPAPIEQAEAAAPVAITPATSPATTPQPEPAPVPNAVPELAPPTVQVQVTESAQVLAAAPIAPPSTPVPAPVPKAASAAPSTPAGSASGKPAIDPCAKGFKKVRSNVQPPKGVIMGKRKPVVNPCK